MVFSDVQNTAGNEQKMSVQTQRLLEDSKTLDVRDRERFSSFVSHALQATGTTEKEFAFQMAVSPASVGRWVQGTSAPHIVLRKVVVEELQRILRGYMYED